VVSCTMLAHIADAFEFVVVEVPPLVSGGCE
jgi:hypothetical protein